MAITQDDIMKLLDAAYTAAIKGIPKVSPPIEKMADDYMKRHDDISKAAKEMHRYQVAKCTTSGFISGFGGLITLPVTVPANIGSVVYVQMRMIACTAYMAGYDIHDDQVQTLIYACLAGVAVGNVFKKFGVALGNKMAMQAIKKIPGKVVTAINQKIGFRLLTKFGEKGLINLGKMVPVAGAFVNGGYDCGETTIIALRAYRQFIKGDFSDKKVKNKDDIIDLDPDDIEEVV